MSPGPQAPLHVFISYARENRAEAAQLADALTADALAVWWDRGLLVGADFAAEISARLQSAQVVVVLWSGESVLSAFVRDESSRAFKAGKLMPVRIEDIELPLGFGQLHTLDLLGWDGDRDDEAYQQLLMEVRGRLQIPPTPQPDPVRPGFKWPRRTNVIAAVCIALALGGGAAWYAQDQQHDDKEALDDANRHFRAGLDQQYAAVPQLETALNEYLSALDRRPQHARARYYLGHVYAQTGKLLDARDSFKLALSGVDAPLDHSQRADAAKQIKTLALVDGEALAVSRADAKPQALPTTPTPPRPPTPTTVAAADTGKSAGAGGGVTPRSANVAQTRQPPMIPPPADEAARLAQSVEGMFDDNKERRINATTSLVLDPQALGDAVPIAVARAIAALKPGVGALGQSASSGVVNTLVLLQNALPGTLTLNRIEIGHLLDAAEPLGDYTAKQAGKVRDLLKAALLHKPVAYLQIANEGQRPMADALSRRLRSFGYEAPAIELVGDRAPGTTQIRVQGKSDRSYARWLGKVVGEIVGEAPVTSSLHNANPKTDTYEIWFSNTIK